MVGLAVLGMESVRERADGIFCAFWKDGIGLLIPGLDLDLTFCCKVCVRLWKACDLDDGIWVVDALRALTAFCGRFCLEKSSRAIFYPTSNLLILHFQIETSRCP